MLTSPWNLLLTLTFSFTALVCVGALIMHRSRSRASGAGMSDGELIDVNHAVMSVAMIAMTWVSVIDVLTWAQVALFAILTLGFLPGFSRAGSRAARFDLGSHIALNVAMIWMLLAMPLLMAGIMDHSAGSAHAGHGAETGGDMLMATPAWADIVNALFIALSAAAAFWWLARLLTRPTHRLHTLCHTAMAAGMSGMLVLMNL